MALLTQCREMQVVALSILRLSFVNYHPQTSQTRHCVSHGSCREGMPSLTAFPLLERLIILQSPVSWRGWMEEWWLMDLRLLHRYLAMSGVDSFDRTWALVEVHLRMAGRLLMHLEW